MSRAGRPDPPKSLGGPGRALWRRIIGALEDGWELDARELHLLAEAGANTDRIAELDEAVDAAGPVTKGSRAQVTVHPALAERRQLQLASLRLLERLELRDPAKVRAREPITSRRARDAAAARWRKSDRLAAVE